MVSNGSYHILHFILLVLLPISLDKGGACSSHLTWSFCVECIESKPEQVSASFAHFMMLMPEVIQMKMWPWNDWGTRSWREVDWVWKSGREISIHRRYPGDLLAESFSDHEPALNSSWLWTGKYSQSRKKRFNHCLLRWGMHDHIFAGILNIYSKYVNYIAWCSLMNRPGTADLTLDYMYYRMLCTYPWSSRKIMPHNDSLVSLKMQPNSSKAINWM